MKNRLYILITIILAALMCFTSCKSELDKAGADKADTKKMDECNLSLLTNEVFQSINKNNHLLSFLSHLRNSIAHGYIGGGDGYIHIIDFANPRSRPVDFTSRGRVEIGIINQFTNILNGIDL